jgi:hypothetical protein
VITFDAHVIDVALEATFGAGDLTVVVLVKSIPVIAMGADLGDTRSGIGHVGTDAVRELGTDVEGAVSIWTSHSSVQTILASKFGDTVDLKKLKR